MLVGEPINHTRVENGNGGRKKGGTRLRSPPSLPEGTKIDHKKVVELLIDAGATPFAGISGAGPLGFALELGLMEASKLMLDMADCGQMKYGSNAHNAVDERTKTEQNHINLVHAAAGTLSPLAEICRRMLRAYEFKHQKTADHLFGLSYQDAPALARDVCKREEVFDVYYGRWAQQLEMLFESFKRCKINPKKRVDETNPKDPRQLFPLAEATMRCDGLVARVLLEAGADPFNTGTFGPLIHTAAQVGCGAVMDALITQTWLTGGDERVTKLLQQKDNFGRVASEIAKDETVKCYLKKAALGILPSDSRCQGASDMASVLKDMAKGERDLKKELPAPEATKYGWRKFEGTPPLASDAPPKCEIVELDSALSSSEFFIKYQSTSNPVIFRGVSTWKKRKWTPKYLKNNAGNESVTTFHIPYGELDGFQGRTTTLGEYLDEMLSATRPVDGTPPQYLFDKNILNTNEKLKKNVKLPAMFGHCKEISRQLIIGPEGSGSPVHFHVGAMNLALFGRKRWFLYPPGRAFWSRNPSLTWYLEDGPKRDGDHYECIQEPGDIMYVPDSFGHAVINLEDSVAVAMEVDEPRGFKYKEKSDEEEPKDGGD